LGTLEKLMGRLRAADLEVGKIGGIAGTSVARMADGFAPVAEVDHVDGIAERVPEGHGAEMAAEPLAGADLFLKIVRRIAEAVESHEMQGFELGVHGRTVGGADAPPRTVSVTAAVGEDAEAGGCPPIDPG